MLTANDIKQFALEQGAVLCGIAPIERFGGAPAYSHPAKVLPGCQSVISFALRFDRSTLLCSTTAPYTLVRNELSSRIHSLEVSLCSYMEANGISSVPTGAIGPTFTDSQTGRSHGLISLKHAAELGGLGRVGRNTLLATPEYGNMVWLGAVLTTAKLPGDPLSEGPVCPPGCSLCVKSCPARALDKEPFNQQACWNHAFKTPEGEPFYIRCHKCRSLCPNCLGTINGDAISASAP